MIRKLIHRLSLSCQKSTQLIEKRFYRKLSLRERIQLRMHTMMCEVCPVYEKQSSILEEGIAKDLNRLDHDIKSKNQK